MRRYDPRVIVREAFASTAASAAATAHDAVSASGARDDAPGATTPASPDAASSDALLATTPPPAPESQATAVETEPHDPEPTVWAPNVTEAELARIRPGQRYFVTGGSAHLRRVSIDALAEDHPVRLAARVEVALEPGADLATDLTTKAASSRAS